MSEADFVRVGSFKNWLFNNFDNLFSNEEKETIINIFKQIQIPFRSVITKINPDDPRKNFLSYMFTLQKILEIQYPHKAHLVKDLPLSKHNLEHHNLIWDDICNVLGWKRENNTNSSNGGFYENPPTNENEVANYLLDWLEPFTKEMVTVIHNDSTWILTHGFKRAGYCHQAYKNTTSLAYAFYVDDSEDWNGTHPPNFGIYKDYDQMIKGVAKKYAELWNLLPQ